MNHYTKNFLPMGLPECIIWENENAFIVDFQRESQCDLSEDKITIRLHCGQGFNENSFLLLCRRYSLIYYIDMTASIGHFYKNITICGSLTNIKNLMSEILDNDVKIELEKDIKKGDRWSRLEIKD